MIKVQVIVFILLLTFTAYYAWEGYGRVIKNIKLGKAASFGGHRQQRWRNVLLIALGQKKMFKRWVPALLHSFIYLAFLFTQIEFIEIIFDGLLGKHRIFANALGPIYTLGISVIEFLSVLALFATVVFIIRRVILKLPRFHTKEMKGWPFKDALYILAGEILLVTAILMMNGADTLLQRLDPAHYPPTGHLPVSSMMAGLFMNGFDLAGLQLIERFGWWLHLLVICGFIVYLPISKHLHIFFAFPNVYFSKLSPRGQMDNMPEIMNEVKSMMGLTDESADGQLTEEIPTFGVKDVVDLSWKQILEAYTCTECGRCTSVCPAHLTGKALSPRKIMMDIRDRADEIGRNIKSGDKQFIKEPKPGDTAVRLNKNNYDDGKSLFDYISKEEIYACTTCQACVEACPVLINPMNIILSMRRYEILTESAGPKDWLPMFTSLENSGCVWQVSDSRTAWASRL